MGRLQAEEMASAGLPLDLALRWHLTSNHYPPVHPVFVPVAQEAIQRANEDDWDAVIVMPNGVSLSVAAIVEGLHLESFLWQDE